MEDNLKNIKAIGIYFIGCLVLFIIKHFVNRLKKNKAMRKQGRETEPIITYKDILTIVGVSVITSIMLWFGLYYLPNEYLV